MRLFNLERDSTDEGEKRIQNESDSGIDRFEKNSNTHFESTYILKPNEKYEANRYHYETDRYGRIKRCEGTLRLEEGKRNTEHQRRAGGKDRLDSDEGGHLIAMRFGGSEKIDNLVPMDSHLNDSEYKALENAWANQLKKDNTVDVLVRCKYTGDSARPDCFRVTYKVTDETGYTVTEKVSLHNGKNGGVLND